jgi:basic membrane protein A
LNQAGYTGLGAIKEKQALETTYVEKVGQPDQVEALSDFARRGYNLVLPMEDSLMPRFNR